MKAERYAIKRGGVRFTIYDVRFTMDDLRCMIYDGRATIASGQYGRNGYYGQPAAQNQREL